MSSLPFLRTRLSRCAHSDRSDEAPLAAATPLATTAPLATTDLALTGLDVATHDCLLGMTDCGMRQPPTRGGRASFSTDRAGDIASRHPSGQASKITTG